MEKYMKTFTKFLGAALATLGLTAVLSAQATVYGPVVVSQSQPKAVSDIKTAVSTDVGIYVRYVGTGTGVATVEVAAGGDITLVANGAADATLECPVSGALGGVIDVSDTACDTIGEVVDVINSSVDWIAVPHASLRSDSSNNTLITLAATDAKLPNGLGLLRDSAVALTINLVLAPGGYDQQGNFTGINAYVNQNSAPGTAGSGRRLTPNPFNGFDTTLLYAKENITTTDNAANLFRAFCVVPNNKDNANSTEVVREMYQEPAGLTTVTALIDEFLNNGGLLCNDGKVVVTTKGTTTLTAPSTFATGRFWVR
jgi:hypothetical protein